MVYKEAGIDDIVRGLTRSGWFCSVYEGRLPGTGQVLKKWMYIDLACLFSMWLLESQTEEVIRKEQLISHNLITRADNNDLEDDTHTTTDYIMIEKKEGTHTQGITLNLSID
ncbi:hypothetical protein Tco_0700758 [Tanacetum coccineum]